MEIDILGPFIEDKQKVYIQAPRRSGKTQFLLDYVELHADRQFIYCGLTRNMAQEFDTFDNVTSCFPAPICRDRDITLILDEPCLHASDLSRVVSQDIRIIAIGTYVPMGEYNNWPGFPLTGFHVITH
jgi:hypothetical protein